jgi:hypothetical protein
MVAFYCREMHPGNEYVGEVTGFPGVKCDDQVDSTTQALAHLKKQRSSGSRHSVSCHSQAVCGVKYLASKCTPFFQTTKVIAAILP